MANLEKGIDVADGGDEVGDEGLELVVEDRRLGAVLRDEPEQLPHLAGVGVGVGLSVSVNVTSGSTVR